jgi:hypothetical protein
MRLKSLVVVTLLFVLPTAVHAQSYAIQGVERYFRVESSVAQGGRGPVMAGYIHNTHGHTVDRVRFVVETLDGAGQVTATTRGQVLGTIPPFDRGYFEVAVPRGGSSYRVRVLSFDPVGRGGGS